MACRISELVLGCRDPEMLALFWCEVLDFVVLDREDDGSVEIGPREGFGGPQPTIILSRRDEPEQGKPRLHIDVNATDRDQDAELERGKSPGVVGFRAGADGAGCRTGCVVAGVGVGHRVVVSELPIKVTHEKDTPRDDPGPFCPARSARCAEVC